MSCEHGNHVEDCDLCDAVDAAYKAGQASVEQRVKDLEELVDRQQGFLSYWKAKCAELTRERDEAVRQWERFERMAGDNWAALKAQAGEPVCWIYELSGYRSIAWGSSKPDFPAAKNPVPLYTHPTTERPYNPLNDYAVIPMNPTEQVKAQAGELKAAYYDGYTEREKEHREQAAEFICPSCNYGQRAGYFRCENCTHEYTIHTTEPIKEQAGEPVAWMNKRGDVISAEEKTLIIENGKLGYPGGEFDLHAKNIERSYTIPLGVINV